jgi:hypothetical protein
VGSHAGRRFSVDEDPSILGNDNLQDSHAPFTLARFVTRVWQVAVVFFTVFIDFTIARCKRLFIIVIDSVMVPSTASRTC